MTLGISSWLQAKHVPVPAAEVIRAGVALSGAGITAFGLKRAGKQGGDTKKPNPMARGTIQSFAKSADDCCRPATRAAAADQPPSCLPATSLSCSEEQAFALHPRS